MSLAARPQTAIARPPQTPDSQPSPSNGHRTAPARPTRQVLADAVATDTPSVAISHARSLRALPLPLLRTTSWTDQCPIRLDTSELATLLHALQTSSQAASARLAHNALAHVTNSQTMGTTANQHADCGVLRCPHEIVTALHRILTRSNFSRGRALAIRWRPR